MPIYEYEHLHDECELAGTRFEVIQSVNDPPLKFCPACGLEVKRLVSRMNVKTKGTLDPDKAARRGFTTWKKSEFGVWEKVAGPGVDVIIGGPEEVEAEKAPGS
ncbi:MAG: zinc ribbon domain-containing protein [Fimbriimonadaceae bacterium]|nr:zinc ribbon domain-containing protein [Fimbriimonadaceae bacterium]QYK55382.1 MAG: zinc ribbon domain-containing protein [Fimbriimonadaceae bacterium]